MSTLSGEHSIASLASANLSGSTAPLSSAGDVMSQPLLLTFELRLAEGGLALALEGSAQESSRLWKALAAVKRLAALRHDWDSYDGKPLQRRAVQRWLSLVLPELLREDLPEPTYVPTADGGLQLEWHQSDVDVEIAVPPEGEIECLVVDKAHGIDHETSGLVFGVVSRVLQRAYRVPYSSEVSDRA